MEPPRKRGRLTDEDIGVLHRTTKINNINFIPWFDEDEDEVSTFSFIHNK